MLLRDCFAIAERLLPKNLEAWHLYGNAEKVYLGACHAVVSRTKDIASAAQIANIFNLYFKQTADEVWIYRPEVDELILKLDELPEGTQDIVRGLLTGVRKIDPKWSEKNARS